ncbi:serine/threonine protein kinase, putative [Ixodes scapularis]|uniref:Serine/threonine protein kinase, putative n=1 Tax=Ixodes scapularis TaxID=6945 RepID=B7PSF9_IXOSC|nr:serine/threonine protein kinase, putative [Ixodes scapularis]|eukprot:XP_002402416.1 serine/threonine protein kinase, putative [Ixodes scapularis]
MPIGMDKQWNRALALAVALAGLVTRNIGRIHPAATPSATAQLPNRRPNGVHPLTPNDTGALPTQVSALSIVTTTQDSAQVPQGPESATTLRRDTTDADGEQPRSSMRPSGHSAPRTPPVTDSAKHNRRISVPSPGAPGLPVGAAVAATEDEGASVVSPGRVHEPEESNSLKWMSTKEPGAKAKKRDDEDSSAGPSHVQLLSPPGGSASARKRKLKSAAAPAHDTGTGKSSGSRTELCGILSGLLGRFRLKSEARRVEAERVAWQAVSHHPFVATLKAYYETTRAWCFVMEYVSRGTLSQIIRRSGPLTETKAKLVSAQLAHALNFVHGAGYLHRDISSSNVLLDDRGNARLIDFGLCQLGLEAKNRCGSLAYMAPEVLRREHYGIGADWWSFGIVLYTMLIGKTPLSQYAAEQNINIQMTRRELRYSNSPGVQSAGLTFASLTSPRY